MKNLATLLPPEAVIWHLNVRDKKTALKLLSAKLAEKAGLTEREIYSTLVEREQLGCTGMGNGVCIPHGRYESLKGLHAIFATIEKPIEFGAADGKPVDLLFVLITPIGANTEHLKALATISRLLRDKQLCANLRAAPNASILHTLLLTAAKDGDAAA
jgi:PTS system nitrogen regulatory IIA component